MRWLLLIHRYLGVALGLLMSLWCLSGFVMIFHPFPSVSEAARLRGLEALRVPAAPRADALGDDDRLRGFEVEMVAGRPILRIGHGAAIDLMTGMAASPLEAKAALTVARDYAAGGGASGAPRDLGQIAVDQWSMEGASGNGPLRHIGFSGAAGDEIYVRLRDGKITQATSRETRLWAWLGAIPHWLYPLSLRRHLAVWTAVVVWSSLAGVFLTVIGLYLGIARIGAGRAGRWSPYGGLFYWHHLTGLAFGVLTLTWVASGLLTMNPWGLLETPLQDQRGEALAGEVSGAAVKAFLTHAPTAASGDIVQLKAAPLDGKLFVMAVGRDGRETRLDAAGAAAPLSSAEALAAVTASAGVAPAAFTRITAPDGYDYNGYDARAVLPAWRARLKDGTLLYVDAASGRLIRAVDGTERVNRWVRVGLHDWDFGAAPFWSWLMAALLAGVTVLCLIGAWMGLERLWRDLRSLAKAMRSSPRPPADQTP